MVLLISLTAWAADGWQLVGVYDATASAHLPDTEDGFTYAPYQAMSDSCGPAKSPDGLGVFEAEVVGGGLSPVLAVLLRGDGRLGPADVRVSLGRDRPEVLLHPMVEPRHLAIDIVAEPGTERFGQLVRTQLETETCMEHKTGRAWTGNDAPRVRQAFLLDPPPGHDRSRKFFGGQTDPVPALIGPPDACLTLAGDIPARSTPSGRGEGSLTLVPTDVWGASLRRCSAGETAGKVVPDAAGWLPLRSGDDTGDLFVRPKRWTGLSVQLSLGDGQSDQDRARVDMVSRGEALLEDAPLFVPTTQANGEPGVPGMIDLLARVPNRYPAAGPPGDRDRYTVLLIPDWQLVEALRRLAVDAPDTPLRTSSPHLLDGVATVLAAPELLKVQVVPETTAPSWPDLAGVMGSVVRRPWGYTVGTLQGRSAIVLPRRTAPTWDESLRAQRGDVHAALLAAFTLVLLALALGLRRIVDLFNPLPEERAHYWPGLATTNLHDNEVNQGLEAEEPS